MCHLPLSVYPPHKHTPIYTHRKIAFLSHDAPVGSRRNEISSLLGSGKSVLRLPSVTSKYIQTLRHTFRILTTPARHDRAFAVSSQRIRYAVSAAPFSAFSLLDAAATRLRWVSFYASFLRGVTIPFPYLCVGGSSLCPRKARHLP